MSNIEAYEANLYQRLDELKGGDHAYTLHEHAIAEAIIFAWRHHSKEGTPQRILDVGCGLGYMAASVARNISDTEVVGIDPSVKAITLAREEHQGVKFYTSSAESFPDLMSDFNEEPFDQAVVNMVLHSVDDTQASAILIGIRRSLKPEGTVLLVVPTTKWLMQKLIEYAKSQQVQRDAGISWVGDQLQKPQVALPVKIKGGTYYPQPLTVFNRTNEQYGHMLSASHFGVPVDQVDERGEHLKTFVLPFWEPKDYTQNYELVGRERSLLLSLALPV